jgi:hypothetical protein
MYKNFPSQGPPKYTQIGIFGMKIYVRSGNPDGLLLDCTKTHQLSGCIYLGTYTEVISALVACLYL